VCDQQKCEQKAEVSLKQIFFALRGPKQAHAQRVGDFKINLSDLGPV